MMKIFFFLLIAAFSSSMAFAQSKNFTSTERGFFSVQLFAGYDQPRLLNSDGSYSSYKGSSYGAAIDVQVWGAFRLFGLYEFGSAGGAQVTTDKLSREQSIIGAKAFANDYIFVAAGVGSASERFKNTVSTTSMNHRVTYMSTGFEYPLSKDWFISATGYYQSGPISKKDNPLSENSYFEASGIQIGIIWSPPITTTTYNSR